MYHYDDTDTKISSWLRKKARLGYKTRRHILRKHWRKYGRAVMPKDFIDDNDAWLQLYDQFDNHKEETFYSNMKKAKEEKKINHALGTSRFSQGPKYMPKAIAFIHISMHIVRLTRPLIPREWF